MSARRTVESCLCLNATTLSRDGALRPGTVSTLRWTRGDGGSASLNIQTEHARVVLDYRDDERGDVRTVVALDTTRNGYGRATWFLCPMPGCGKRVATLFIGGQAGSRFACRMCHVLAYESWYERAAYRALRRRDKIRARLDTGRKRAKTILRLSAELRDLERRALVLIAERL